MKYRLSVIMPYFLKWPEFKFVWPHNLPQFERDDLEVIICLDEPSSEGRVWAMVAAASINVRILVCRERHEWRCPAKAINVGLRHARGEYALVLPPEGRLSRGAIDNLLHRSGPARMVSGFVRWCEVGKPEPEFPSNKLFYGSLTFPIIAAKYVGGYDECFCTWAGDDDDFMARMQMANLAMVHEYSVWIDHFEPASSSLSNRTTAASVQFKPPTSRICPKCFPNWGRSYDETILFKER